jgi:hypothetical protein
VKSRLLALATWLLASGCATVPPEQAERDAIVIKAARACQLSHPGVHITGVDQYGRLEATYHASKEWAGFRVCFQAELKRLMGTTEFGAGRVVVPPSGPGPTTVPLELTGSVFLVRAMVDGTYPVTLLLDTGASLTIVRPQALAAARVEVSRMAPKILGIVVGGQTVSMPYVRLRSLSVGDATVESIDVAAYDATPHRRDVDGLLGGNFLNHFTVTIDRASRLLTLTRSGVVAGAPAAAASDRVWEAPVWTAGDEWRTQWRTPAGDGTFTRTVEGEEIVDDVPHWIVKSGRSRIYFVKSGLAWHFEKRDDETVLRRDPPVGYDWPVRVGKSWVHEYQLEEPAAGKSARVYRRCLAADEATTTVPAGTFLTLHVVCRDRADRIAYEHWYAAEPKSLVRERIALSGGDRWQELVSYRVTPAPVPALPATSSRTD